MVKGTTGTHYKSSANRKTKVVNLRLTEAEYEDLQSKARLSGMTVSEFVLDSIGRRRIPGFVSAGKKVPQIPGQMSLEDL